MLTSYLPSIFSSLREQPKDIGSWPQVPCFASNLTKYLLAKNMVISTYMTKQMADNKDKDIIFIAAFSLSD